MGTRVLRHRPSPAMVVACLALLVALSGTGYAAIRLPAKSVGAKQLKTAAVTNVKIARHAVTGGKVARNTLTGTQIKESTLATVPRAAHAATADNATHATTADSASTATHAGTADTASGLVAPEGWHLVGAPGEPAFENSWHDSANTSYEPVSFYKDRGGVVHLRGRAIGGSPNNALFQLPAGYRPAAGRIALFAAACECDGTAPTSSLTIEGSGFSATFDGGVAMLNGSVSGGGTLSLDGISFLAES